MGRVRRFTEQKDGLSFTPFQKHNYRQARWHTEEWFRALQSKQREKESERKRNKSKQARNPAKESQRGWSPLRFHAPGRWSHSLRGHTQTHAVSLYHADDKREQHMKMEGNEGLQVERLWSFSFGYAETSLSDRETWGLGNESQHYVCVSVGLEGRLGIWSEPSEREAHAGPSGLLKIIDSLPQQVAAFL